MDEPSLLRIENVRLTLPAGRVGSPPREVLRGVSLAIPRGVSVALLGTSGSGKTLLCRAVTRFFDRVPVREVTGSIWFDGRNLLAAGQAELFQIRGARIGHLLQNAHEHFHPWLTIAQHFELFLGQKPGTIPDRVAHAASYLYRVGVVDPDELLQERVFPEELDVASRQRIMIALVLSGEPDLLVADEPTAEFDRSSVARIAGAVESLKRQRGLSVLFATGQVRRAEQFGDLVAILDEGQIVDCAPPAKLFGEAKEEITGAFVDGTLIAGRPKERLLADREFLADR